MNRWLTAAMVAAMLAVPLASAASFTQAGNGPQRTGVIDYEGPQTNDTVFEVQLPGVPMNQPALVDDDLYVVTLSNEYRGYDGDTENLTESALWRIGLDDASVERVMDLPLDEGLGPIAGPLNPDRILMEDGGPDDLVAVEVPSGEELWRTQVLPDDPRTERGYSRAVQVGDTLYVGFVICCAGTSGFGATAFGTEQTGGVMALDVATGDELWTWTRSGEDTSEVNYEEDAVEDRRDPVVNSVYVSADEDRVYAYIQLWNQPDEGAEAEGEYAEAEASRRVYELRAIEDGEDLWHVNDTPQRRTGVYTSQESAHLTTETGFQCCAFPVVTETMVSTRLDAFEARNPATGEEVWTSEAGRSDHIERQGAYSMGIRGDALVGTSPQTVYRLDAAEQGEIDWQDTSTDLSYANEPTVLDEDTAYVPFHPDRDDDSFYDIGIEARDLETGAVRWRWAHNPDVGIDDPGFNQDSANPAFGPGVVAWPAKDGTVTVVGETEASLGEPDVPEAQYPGVGNETTIDASGAEPGVHGEVTRYMVDWGDGTISGWQASPVFTHAYNESGTYEAQVYAGNDANQTSSTVVTMNVGQEAPAEPNWLSERFEKDNQDMTFGVLGLAVALGGGAVGVARRKRKQSILQEELEALEEGFEETKDEPGECEAFLETRKARARSLMMDGTLDEEQFGVIESRVEELGRQLRTSVLDERFQFLPYGLVQSLKKMLADGKISNWELEAVETLLEDEEALSEAQKEKVRHQLDRWLVEDGGGGAA